MTEIEIIEKGKHKVRKNSSLMLFYIEAFKAKFGYKPACAGCTFNSDWEKFVRGNKSAESKKFVDDVEKTFRLKKPSADIFMYRKDGKPYRMYGNKLTEHYVVEYLTHGTPEEITKRKELFAILPKQLQ